MRNPTTNVAVALRRTNIPIAETHIGDSDDLWAFCPRCGSYHRHEGANYTQGLVNARCWSESSFVRRDMPALYFIEIVGVATQGDIRRFRRWNLRRYVSAVLRKSRPSSISQPDQEPLAERGHHPLASIRMEATA